MNTQTFIPHGIHQPGPSAAIAAVAVAAYNSACRQRRPVYSVDTPDSHLLLEEAQNEMNACFATLSDRETAILERYLGVSSVAQTYEQIAECYGISRQRVTEIVTNAVSKIRRKIKMKGGKYEP